MKRRLSAKTSILLYGIVLPMISGGCTKAPVSQLANDLKSTDISTRHEAAKALEGYGSEAAPAVPELIVALSDQEPRVRYRSAKALSKMGVGAAPAAEAISKALPTAEPETRYYLVKTLANIENPVVA